jgi:hypothetical protein
LAPPRFDWPAFDLLPAAAFLLTAGSSLTKFSGGGVLRFGSKNMPHCNMPINLGTLFLALTGPHGLHAAMNCQYNVSDPCDFHFLPAAVILMRRLRGKSEDAMKRRMASFVLALILLMPSAGMAAQSRQFRGGSSWWQALTSWVVVTGNAAWKSVTQLVNPDDDSARSDASTTIDPYGTS